MNAIVIPVKVFADAKSRLSCCLSTTARAGLAEAMCKDLFQIAGRVRGVDRIFVVSNEMRALKWAKQRGWTALPEAHQISESASVDLVCRHCQQTGVQSLLRIPTDIPLVQSSDIEEIFAELPQSPACVIVPSRDGTGTNALLRSPPALFPSFFGKDSFTQHLAAARDSHASVKILRNARIGLDIDEPGDLERMRGVVAADSHTGRWISETDRAPQAGSGPGRFPKAHPA